jgi:hypothetical protein
MPKVKDHTMARVADDVLDGDYERSSCRGQRGTHDKSHSCTIPLHAALFPHNKPEYTLAHSPESGAESCSPEEQTTTSRLAVLWRRE